MTKDRKQVSGGHTREAGMRTAAAAASHCSQSPKVDATATCACLWGTCNATSLALPYAGF
jgi:hypothetical protein